MREATDGSLRGDKLTPMGALALVDSIPGWLRPEDAEKLYELAGSTPGPILEIGTHRGKSAVLMALATKDSGRDAPIYTLDVDRSYLREAEIRARTHSVSDVIVFVRGTLAAFARAYPHLRPKLTFIDGDHSKFGVESDLAVLEALVPAGGILLFHDFDDPLNDDPACPATKVRPTVEASWVTRQCEFNGIFGCCGMFTRRDRPDRVLVPMVDLLPLEGYGIIIYTACATPQGDSEDGLVNARQNLMRVLALARVIKLLPGSPPVAEHQWGTSGVGSSVVSTIYTGSVGLSPERVPGRLRLRFVQGMDDVGGGGHEHPLKPQSPAGA
jgi:predicted O-methyltransferase YrrM